MPPQKTSDDSHTVWNEKKGAGHVEELELPALGRVYWYNQGRLRGFIGDIPPAEFEEEFYVENRQEDFLAENITQGSL